MHNFKVKKSNVTETLNFTDEVVKNYPNRLIGTQACKEASRRIAQELEKICEKGSVKMEEFRCHPRAFVKWIRPAVIAYAATTGALWLRKPRLSLLALGSAMSVFTSQFVFYKEYFDRLFKEESGYNVWGILEPEGEVKQQIVLCGHHDAPFVFHFMARSPKFYPLMIAAGIVPFVIGIPLVAYSAITGRNPGWIRTLMTAAAAGVIPLWWFTTEEVAPGAGDNMIAVALSVEGLKMFAEQKKAGNPLKHTRVICLSVDGEECGLRGSRAFVKRHLRELKDVKTYAFCMDTLYNADKLIFFDNDLNLTVDLSHEMAQELKDIATELGYGAKVDHMPWGGGSTDAASFGQVGIEASALLAFELDVTKLENDLVYHTPNDTTDHIETEVVEQALNMIKEYIFRKDRKSAGK